MVLGGYIVASLCLGGFLGYQFKRTAKVKPESRLHKDYLVGLNFLLNEETDKAVEIFIKMLEVDSDTLETHLALGNLFRRRGEVDRAIRIHQNLIARPQLDKTDKTQALLALGQDYLSAGVLDRAETIFLEELRVEERSQIALSSLLDIYQQEKEWNKAIKVALKLSAHKQGMQAIIAHHYCELAEHSRSQGQLHSAIQFLKRALAYDTHCARANIIQGEIFAASGKYKQAIKYLLRVRKQAPEFLGETVKTLSSCFEKTKDMESFVLYMKQCMKEYPSVHFIRALADRVLATKGKRDAINFVAECARKYPSIWSMELLIEFNLLVAEGKAQSDLIILQDLVKKVLAEKSHYVCESCGMSSNVLHWQCRRCKTWSAMKPVYLHDRVEYELSA